MRTIPDIETAASSSSWVVYVVQPGYSYETIAKGITENWMPDSISHWSQTCNCLILGFLYNIAHTFIVYLDFLFVPGSMLIDTIVKGIGSPRFPYHHSNFLTQHLRVFPQSGSAVPETGFVIYCCCCCCKVASVVSDSVRPHKRQSTRLPRPWDSPGKSTGVGCHMCTYK